MLLVDIIRACVTGVQLSSRCVQEEPFEGIFKAQLSSLVNKALATASKALSSKYTYLHMVEFFYTLFGLHYYGGSQPMAFSKCSSFLGNSLF